MRQSNSPDTPTDGQKKTEITNRDTDRGTDRNRQRHRAAQTQR